MHAEIILFARIPEVSERIIGKNQEIMLMEPKESRGFAFMARNGEQSLVEFAGLKERSGQSPAAKGVGVTTTMMPIPAEIKSVDVNIDAVRSYRQARKYLMGLPGKISGIGLSSGTNWFQYAGAPGEGIFPSGLEELIDRIISVGGKGVHIVKSAYVIFKIFFCFFSSTVEIFSGKMQAMVNTIPHVIDTIHFAVIFVPPFTDAANLLNNRFYRCGLETYLVIQGFIHQYGFADNI